MNGAAGVVIAPEAGRSRSWLHRDGKIVAIDVPADPERLHRLDLAALDH